ncbi:MAG: ABC transporter substrate-binding protein [Bacillota bacterium]|nr:ABC transporter substrate-binding protein [Bacillota bacterium]
MKKKLLLVICCVMALMAFAACGGEDGETTATDNDGKTVTIAMGTGSEPAAGFDPAQNWGAAEHCHEPLIQSTLVNTDTDMNIVNDIATEYSVSDDGMTWTFKIRDDVKFSDGTDLTASDVAFTLNTVKNSENSEMDLTMMDSATAIDATTVEISMTKPYNAFLYSLAVIGIVPEASYDSATYGESPIGSGRYLLEQWDKGQQIILVANPDYYGEAPKMERVVVVFMEEDAALAAAKKGEVDIAYTAATYSDQTVEGYELLAIDSVDSRGISLPTQAAGGTLTEDDGTTYEVGNDVTSDIAIRQAMNYGVDREAMIDNVLNGYGKVAYSACDGMPWASPDMVAETDIEKAKSILADGGWADNDGDGILEKGDLKAEFTLYYSSSDSVRQAIAVEFSNQMKELGINITYEGASWDDLYPHQYSDAVVWGWGSNSPSEEYNLYYSTGWGNFPQYASEELDAAFDAALAAPTLEDSYPLWQDALAGDGTNGVTPDQQATWVWFATVQHLYFSREDLSVADQKLHPHGHGWSLVNNVDQWSWE